MQVRVRKRFGELQKLDEGRYGVPWRVVDAARTVEEVQADIWGVVEETLTSVEAAEPGGKPLRRMWDDGNIDLTELEEEKEN